MKHSQHCSYWTDNNFTSVPAPMDQRSESIDLEWPGCSIFITWVVCVSPLDLVCLITAASLCFPLCQVPTLGSQEGAFENVRMNYSGDQGQTIRQLISAHVLRRVAMCVLSSPHGRRQHLAVSHEKGKVGPLLPSRSLQVLFVLSANKTDTWLRSVWPSDKVYQFLGLH